jgi:hypothetical protein
MNMAKMTVICARGRNEKCLGMLTQKPQRKKGNGMPRHRWEDITDLPCLCIYKQLSGYRKNIKFRRHCVTVGIAFKCLKIGLDGGTLTTL